MAEFIIGKDYKEIVNNMLKHIVYYPIEMQLVWLTEILMYLVYINNVGTSKLIKKGSDNNHYTMGLKDLVTILGSELGIFRTIKLCISFRNEYVHLGALLAYDSYVKILENKDEI